jgi:inner membrane protein
VPSPLGHVIAGVAAGWLVAGAPRQPSLDDPAWRHAALFGALGALPDVDLLVGAHSGPTHSIGAAAIVGVVAALVQLARTRPHKHPGTLAPSHPGTLSTLAPWHPGTLGVACALSFASHILLDWLSRDTTAPIGIMALWPFSHAYYESDLHVFMAISRRYYQGWTFVRHNVLAVAREIAILLPVLALVVVMRRRGKPAG